MATTSKREQLRKAVTKPRRRRTAADRAKLGQALLGHKGSTPPPLQKVMFVIEAEDLAFLDQTVATLKATRRRTSKSEMVRLGISIMKKLSLDQLREELRNLD